MKRIILASALGLFALQNISAQSFQIQPTPQEYVTSQDSLEIPHQISLITDNIQSNRLSAISLIKSLWKNQIEEKGFPVYLGIKGDKSIHKYKKNIPHKAEGYYLSIEKDKIVIAGADEQGLFYGVQTLAQLLTLPKLPLVQVTDYPDLPYRGVVEGFYGTPWSHDARLRQLEFYGKNKLNVYLYGPKDDPYHSTPNWRKPYPPKEAAQLKALVDKAKENEVIFYWAIHPGQDIRWNTEDRDALMQKFESMYELGVRAFAVFFDDISGEGTKAEKQAELLNYLDDNFVKVKGDVAPLVMCPTEYNKSWSDVKGGYLTTLGDKLNKDIQIMWTGDRVIACIDKPSMEFINPLLKRKAYIWWNFPVSDYVRDHLLMGPVYGNGLDIKDDMAAFVSNPMERAEASKIALYSIADYAWNLESYQSEVSWKRAIRDLMPQHAKYLETFAAHNSDLGENGHGFRRDESVKLQPALKTLSENYTKEGKIDEKAYQEVADACQQIILSADMLMASKTNRPLIKEIKPWLIQFKLTGEYGQQVLQMIQEQVIGETENFKETYAHAQALQVQMGEVDATYNQNPYQPGVKSGSKYLIPTFNALFEASTIRFNKQQGTQLDTRAEYHPYSLSSDVTQLALLPVRRKGRTGAVSSSNEVILWQAEGQLTLTMDYPRSLGNIILDLGTLDIDGKFTLEVQTTDGNWKILELKPTNNKTLLVADAGPEQILQFRLKNTSGTLQKVYFKRCSFNER